LPLGIENIADFSGLGMGVLSHGTPYLNQRGLGALCGVQNAHVGTISSQWGYDDKPRIKPIGTTLAKAGYTSPSSHVDRCTTATQPRFAPAKICLPVLEYYAFDAGTNCQFEAPDNF